MDYEYRRITDLKCIYDYFRKNCGNIPYMFETDYEIWLKSYTADTDHDDEKMFDEIITYAAFSSDEIAGFIAFGISRYIYNESGEKDRSVSCGIIRQLHIGREHNCGGGLISIAEGFFNEQNVSKRAAFFHAFGMTCYAGHGKLFCGLPHIEQAVLTGGYEKEHENVYYRRFLTEADCDVCKNVSVSFSAANKKGLCEFTVYAEKRAVGAGAVVYLPQGGICYLKWIYIYENEQRKGYGSAALRALFSVLYSKGIKRFDTDTADRNTAAQALYTKTGFEYMGRTRSYMKYRQNIGTVGSIT